MSRKNRIALFLAAVLVVALAGAALANRAPIGDEPASQVADEAEVPEQAAIDHAVERLTDAGIDADPALVGELASEYGVGGAVRILAWADEGVATVAEIRAMRADGRGWGEIARDLGVHPGIGSIMGDGGGHGREDAPGQQKDRDTDD